MKDGDIGDRVLDTAGRVFERAERWIQDAEKLILEEPIPTERWAVVERDRSIEALTRGMSMSTAARVRGVIFRAIKQGHKRDQLLGEEYPALLERLNKLEHSHAPGGPHEVCELCAAEDEEQRILGQAEHCLAQLGGRR